MAESRHAANLKFLERTAATNALRQWQIRRYVDGSLRAVGREASACGVKVSKPIERIDLANKLVATSTELVVLLDSPLKHEHGPNSDENSGPSTFGRSCCIRATDSHVDITSLLFDDSLGHSLCAEVQAVARTREFLETIVASEDALLWDLVRTCALMLLRRFPLQSDCALMSQMHAVRSIAASQTRD
ncbi:hypothetical protein A9R05_21285 [Burkholderia sp. KK1]|nr:hypothetical protein A9R05_21285 [Burkholderia sp. KK1]